MFVQQQLCTLKGIPHAKYGKNPIDNASFFTFFTTLDLIWLEFAPRQNPMYFFFADFQWNMLEDSINIHNFICNTVVLK